LEDLGIGGRIILKRILNRKGGYAMVYYGLGKRQMTGCFECVDEPSDSIKYEDFLTSCETVRFLRRIRLRCFSYIISNYRYQLMPVILLHLPCLTLHCLKYRSERLSNITNLTLRRLMSYIYGAPILDVSRSHTTTQHSR